MFTHTITHTHYTHHTTIVNRKDTKIQKDTYICIRYIYITVNENSETDDGHTEPEQQHH